jgi:hypothetical protein
MRGWWRYRGLQKFGELFYLLYIHDHVPFFFTFCCVKDALLFDTVSWADDSRANLSCKVIKLNCIKVFSSHHQQPNTLLSGKVKTTGTLSNTGCLQDITYHCIILENGSYKAWFCQNSHGEPEQGAPGRINLPTSFTSRKVVDQSR